MNEAVEKIKARILDLQEELQEETHNPLCSPGYTRYLQGSIDGYNNALYIFEKSLGDLLAEKD